MLSINSIAPALRKEWLQTRDVVQTALDQGRRTDAQHLLLEFAKRNRTTQEQAVVQRLALEMLPADEYAEGVRTVVHGMLAEAFARLEEHDDASRHAALAFALRDKLSRAAKPSKRVISFSLYGGKSVYCECAVLNAEYLPKIYPGWIMRVYHDDSVPKHTLERLARVPHVELVHAATLDMPALPGTFWRFFAVDDLDVDVVLFRDIDSVIGMREKVLVDEWLASDKLFHVIRDWYSHTDLMLAGTWGARGGILGGMKQRTQRFLDMNLKLHPTHADQHFLAREVWPRIRDQTLQHASVFRGAGMQWPADLPLFGSTESDPIMQIGSWDITEIHAHSDQPCLLQLSEDGVPFATYLCQPGEALEVPREYRERLESGRYRVTATPVAISVS